MLNALNTLFQRDLDRLTQELTDYPNQSELWLVKGAISNSAGNLALHICGNLQHFLGAILGNTGYVRNRDYEFKGTDVSVKDLLAEIEVTKKVVHNVFTNLTASDIESDFPMEVFGHPMTTKYFILHLSTHLSYHLGQINYHRRLIS